MTKCDLCRDEVAQGRVPACVAACPMRAIGFGDISDLRTRHGDQCEVYPLARTDKTQPNLVVRAHKDVNKAKAQSARITPPEEL